MAISRLAGQDAKGTTAVTNVISATYAAPPTQGNLLIATTMAGTSAPGNTTIPGWTRLMDQGVNNTAQELSLFYKVAGASESTTITATGLGSATLMRIHIYEYTGVTYPRSMGTTTSNTTSVGTLQTASIATTVDPALVFVCVGRTTASFGTLSWDGGFSTRQVDADPRLGDGDFIASATATFAPTATMTSSTGPTTSIIAVFTAKAPTVMTNYQAVSVGDGMSVSEKIR